MARTIGTPPIVSRSVRWAKELITAYLEAIALTGATTSPPSCKLTRAICGARPPATMESAYLVAKCLRRVVNDHGFGEVASQNAEVLDVVAVHADAVLAKQPVPASANTLTNPASRHILLSSHPTLDLCACAAAESRI